MRKTKYPRARRGKQVDDYFGNGVADPYRWMEDPDSPETQAWVNAQIELTDKHLSNIPARELFVERLKKLWNVESLSAPFRRGTRQFFYRNAGLQNHSVLYVVDPNAEPRVLIDPNTFSQDGTIAMSNASFTEDGSLVAYTKSIAGSDWTEMKVRDVTTGEDLSDHLKWLKWSSASWKEDNSGFYYSRHEEPKSSTEPSIFNKVYFHEIGTEQSEDRLVFEPPKNQDWLSGAYETKNGEYLVIQIYTSSSGNNRVYVKNQRTGVLTQLLSKEDAHWSVIDNDGSIFWFFTDLDAPRGKVVAIDVSKSTDEHLEMKELISQPEDTHTIMEGVSTLGNRFFVSYSKDVHSQVAEYGLDGSFIREVKLPGIGSAGGFHGRMEDMETYYTFTSYTQPATIYHYDVIKGESTLYRAPQIDIDPTKYASKLVFATSKDGTQIPLFISYRKGLKRNGNNPTYLYGYGGFGISLGPGFASHRTMLMDMGGIYAEAILRGGGEYGEEWHQAGTKERKQNVFDDFIACAEWLIDNKYTSSPKLAIAGGSNGGLLVGACMTQRPELFGACLPAVGVMDMLRFDKFTGGKFWRDDYGSAENSKEEFEYLYAYSPYHNIKKGTAYPPTLVKTADHDDRVVPAHSYKFTAALQRAQGGNAPCLIQIEKNAGHGAGKPLSMVIQSIADDYGFLVDALKIPKEKLFRLE